MAEWEEFYVIHKESGQALLHQSFSEKRYDPDLFAGLLTAILSFAQAYSKNTIGSFEMKKKVISIGQAKKYPILFVYIVDSKTAKNKKKISAILKHVSDEFEKIYSEQFIKEWNGNIIPFREFGKKIDALLHPWNNYEDFGF